MINQFQQRQAFGNKNHLIIGQGRNSDLIQHQNSNNFESQIFQQNQSQENLEATNQRKESQLTNNGVNHYKKINRYYWAPQQEDLLLKLYEQIGPQWSLIVSKFQNKTQNCIKNKFNSCFRRAVKILDQHEKKVLRKLGRGINNKIVGVMLQISSQARELIIKEKLTVNKESSLFKFRNIFLRLCFRSSEFTSEDLTNFSNLIKGLNTKMRCFGAFKRKYVKGWKLTQSNIQTICQFDQICLQQEQLLKNKVSSNPKKQKNNKQISQQDRREQQVQNMQIQPSIQKQVPVDQLINWGTRIASGSCFNSTYQNIYNVGYPEVSMLQGQQLPIISYPFSYPYMLFVPEQEQKINKQSISGSQIKLQNKQENIIITFHGEHLLK